MDVKIDKLINLLNNLPISKWGIGDITGFHPLSESFPKVLSLTFAYIPDFQTYNEEKLQNPAFFEPCLYLWYLCFFMSCRQKIKSTELDKRFYKIIKTRKKV